ncbi:MAG: trypsin-like peptidase domain-containing protein, partial [Chloroflexota bacterium]|nr:trypsin-like peptidase domain-containing protein [Chloroflexota bacterium]
PTPPPQVTAPPNPEWTLPPPSRPAQPLPDFVSVVAKVKPSVVAINTEVVTLDIFNRQFIQEGAGSGWIIDPGGLIATNNHVIQDARNITVTLADGRTFTGKVAGADAFSDLAVVKIDATNLPAITIGDSTRMQIGEWVLAIGNALGMGISAKEGIVSRQGVSVPVSTGQTLYDLIETSAAINPGNSGGPLVNMYGEVIGITSAKLSAVGIEGLGYAISSNTFKPIIENLTQKGYLVRPWLGVTLSTVNQFLQLRYNLAVDKGAFVSEVAAGSPADKAGLKQADVIVGVNGKEVASAEDLIQIVRSSQIGQQIEIKFWRGDSQKTTSATLIESPPS